MISQPQLRKQSRHVSLLATKCLKQTFFPQICHV